MEFHDHAKFVGNKRNASAFRASVLTTDAVDFSTKLKWTGQCRTGDRVLRGPRFPCDSWEQLTESVLLRLDDVARVEGVGRDPRISSLPQVPQTVPVRRACRKGQFQNLEVRGLCAGDVSSSHIQLCVERQNFQRREQIRGSVLLIGF